MVVATVKWRNGKVITETRERMIEAIRFVEDCLTFSRENDWPKPMVYIKQIGRNAEKEL